MVLGRDSSPHTCAILDRGERKCWDNATGQLGLGDVKAPDSLAPPPSKERGDASVATGPPVT